MSATEIEQKQLARDYWSKVINRAFALVFISGICWLMLPLYIFVIIIISGVFTSAYAVLIFAYVRRDKLREEIAELEGNPWSVAKSTWRITQALMLGSVLVFAIVLAFDQLAK